MRLLICAGGTGGGVYPAMSILQALGTDADPVLWVGGQGGMEAGLVQRAGVPFKAIPAAGVHGVGWRVLPRNIWSLLRGTFASSSILRQFKPDALIFTGGYVAAPMAVAAWRVPTLLYVPDIEPGMALKFLAKFARVIAVTSEESRAYFPANKQVVVTGYPTRPELSQWNRQNGRAQLGLDEDRPVLLVTGGSKGARSINRALLANLEKLLGRLQVVHITGKLDWAEVETFQKSLPAGLARSYHPYEYLHDMGAALASADLIVTRAGASTLGELPLFGLPAVLVPYPYAWRYQKVNADHLASNGAAVILEDARLNDQLLDTIMKLFDQPEQLETMRQAMKALSRPDAAQSIAGLVRSMAGEKLAEGRAG